MRAAGMISVAMGMLDPAAFERQQALIRACGLPDAAPGLDPAAVIAATAGDKKVRGGAVRWVLLERLGSATTRADVPPEAVRSAVEAVCA
jgi:3-dehydroquinate synthetase